ncbi:MAG: hypothetical protein Kow0047_26250 [Anaerolineae bacterium]
MAENHRRLCEAVGADPDSLVSPRQVHGARIVRVGGESRGRIIPDCDGLVTDEPGVALLLRFADCVPLIAYDPEHHAVGVAHAGWRGTIAGIARNLVEAMGVAFHSRPDKLIVGIGPSIGPCCYQVGADVLEAARRTWGELDGLFQQREDDGLFFDLWAANRRLLEDAGVRSIEVSGLCTACHVDEFYSHRRERGMTGHHGALAMLL